MTRKRSSEYVPAPTIPREMATRYDAILGALYGSVSVSEAAARAGLSRNRFQSLMHRAQAAFLEALEPRSAGRPPTKTTRERELEEEVAKGQRREASLREKLEMAQHLFGVAGEMMRGIRRGARGRKGKKAAAKATPNETDPEPASTPTRRSPRWMGRMRVELGRRLLRTASAACRTGMRSTRASPVVSRCPERRRRAARAGQPAAATLAGTSSRYGTSSSIPSLASSTSPLKASRASRPRSLGSRE